MTDKREAAFEQYNAGYDAGLRDSGGEWVAVSERLPEISFRQFLVTNVSATGQARVRYAYWDGSEWLMPYKDVIYSNVTAWRELPEPYNQEKTND